MAAVTAAAAGGFLGGAGGTVAGAAVASVVTTVAEAVYQRSLERTGHRVRNRLDAHRTRGRPAADATTALAGHGAGRREAAPPTSPAAPEADESPTRVISQEVASPRPVGTTRRRIAVLAATGVVIFLVAMVAVTGIERVKGSPLSGGNGTSVGEVFGTRAPTTTTGAPEGEEPTSASSTTAGEQSTAGRESTETTTPRGTATTTPSTTPSRQGERAPGLTLELPTR